MAKGTARAGFSLAELMVVIVIIGLLATAVTQNVFGFFGQSKEVKAKSDVLAIYKACENFYYQNNSRWPESIEQLVEKAEGTGTRYLNNTKVPKDPWGNEYELEEVDGGLLVWCRGKDGQPGGEGENKDFSSQMVQDGE